jgi:methylated-DNA-[protein]-cysteine S-methyltransferase
MSTAYALFDTAIGRCAIAWSGAAIIALQLPEADDARTRARVLRRWPRAQEQPPPPGIQRAADAVIALLSGAVADLAAVVLDMERVPAFDRRVYEGNPFAVIVPCHRVTAAAGKAGGFSATGGVATKLRLLEIERARLGREPTLFDRDDAFARLQSRG